MIFYLVSKVIVEQPVARPVVPKQDHVGDEVLELLGDEQFANEAHGAEVEKDPVNLGSLVQLDLVHLVSIGFDGSHVARLKNK